MLKEQNGILGVLLVVTRRGSGTRWGSELTWALSYATVTVSTGPGDMACNSMPTCLAPYKCIFAIRVDFSWGSLGGSAGSRLPLAQGAILESQRGACFSLCLRLCLPLSVSIMNK